MNYNPQAIEKKWQDFWKKSGFYQAEDVSKKPKSYILIEFPYLSGQGLHVGHARSYLALDAVARKKRMQGFNVLFPIGWDAFGLPAENYAIKTGIHPKETTAKNIVNYRRQLESLGLSFDWSREVNTTDPGYYKWTQWIFLKLFERGLAYQAEIPVNWCPSCKIGLANEEVISGTCERCGAQTEKKLLKQWMLKITAFADRLIDDLKEVNFPETIKSQQINWIGKSYGTEISFKVEEGEELIKVFTTRADTIFGVTAVVLAPENSLLEKLTKAENKEKVDEYIAQAEDKSDFERAKVEKEKTGVFTGSYCINPVNSEKVPVWAGDYVVAGYGGGAVMVVPAHDKRDYDFAKKYNLEINPVIVPELGNIKEDKEIELAFETVKEISRAMDDASIKIWFIGTMAVIPYFGRIFSKPADVDCGVRREDFTKAKNVIENFGYQKIADKDHGKFKTSTYKKENTILEIGTFDEDLGDNLVNFDGAEYRVAAPEILGSFYRVKAEKERREGKNDLERAIFLELISGTEEEAFVDYGILINSGEFNGLSSKEAIEEIAEYLEKKGAGRKTIQYKLRDWVFSRQHYWGEPIPIIHCKKCGQVPVPESDLPVELPYVEKYQPTGTGESPLSAITDWVDVKCPKCQGPAKRETDTMPNWAGSNWYFMRYVDPKNDKALAGKDKLKYWLPVDWYNGGFEHTTLHLLYSRFIYKFLYDIGIAPTLEPYQRRTSHGIVLAEDNRKMSKSFGNVVNPDDVVKEYGADTLRLYEMFMGPFDQAIAWSTNGMKGCYRFLQKVWNIVSESESGRQSSPAVISALHKLIKKIDGDIENTKFNTIIAGFMEFINFCQEKNKEVGQDTIEIFLIILSPFAPHIAEELWQILGRKDSISREKWPEYDPKFIKDEKVDLIIQINGKVRDKIEVRSDISEEEAKAVALSLEKIKNWVLDKEIKKVIFVPGRLINIVV